LLQKTWDAPSASQQNDERALDAFLARKKAAVATTLRRSETEVSNSFAAAGHGSRSRRGNGGVGGGGGSHDFDDEDSYFDDASVVSGHVPRNERQVLLGDEKSMSASRVDTDGRRRGGTVGCALL
jgi:hypothetical protein